MTYSASRRKHSHRCTVCRKIVADGAEVIMLREDKGSKVVHVEPCSARQHSPGVDHAEAFRLWGVDRNARLGFRDAQAERDAHPFFRAGG
jgi:hypothetical protein